MQLGSTFLVTFKKDTPQDVIDKHMEEAKSKGCKINHVYKTTVKGYSVVVPDDAVNALSTHENIVAIEADGEVTTQGKALLKQ
jgi:Peptidase inhibitor I9